MGKVMRRILTEEDRDDQEMSRNVPVPKREASMAGMGVAAQDTQRSQTPAGTLMAGDAL